jgi:tRNA A37 threonylcarbamoyladenosine modification protein TsaB
VITLSIDASTYVGTVAVLRDRALVAEGEAMMRGEEEERLMPAVVATLGEAGC